MKALRFKLWIDEDRQLFLGNGRVRLLQAIDETGSISAAARTMGLSYKKAWEQVDAMNSMVDEPLVVTNAGGKGGGGTELTMQGRQWVRRFDELNENVRIWMQQQHDLD